MATRAAELGSEDAVALSAAGFGLSDISARLEDADALIEGALDLNPNDAMAWLYSGWTKTNLGQPETALERIALAQRFSPNDPQRASFYAVAAYAHLFAGRHEEAHF